MTATAQLEVAGAECDTEPGGLSAEDITAGKEFSRRRSAFEAAKEWVRGLDPGAAQVLAEMAVDRGVVDPHLVLLSLEPDELALLIGDVFAACDGQCRKPVLGETGWWPGKPCPKHAATP